MLSTGAMSFSQDSARISHHLENKKKCSERKYQIIEYDLKNGVFDEAMIKPCQKVPTVIRIKNVNPIYYSIEVKAADKIISNANEDVSEIQSQKPEISPTPKMLSEVKNYTIDTNLLTFAKSERSSVAPNQKSEYKEVAKKFEDSGKRRISLEEEIKNATAVVQTQKIQEKENLNAEIDLLEQEMRKLEAKDNSNELFIEGVIQRVGSLNQLHAVLVNNLTSIIKVNENYNNFLDKVISSEMTYDEYQLLVDSTKAATIKKPIESTFLLEQKNLNFGYTISNLFRENQKNLINNLNNFLFYINSSDLKNNPRGEAVLASVLKETERMKAQAAEYDRIVNEINLPKKLNQVEKINRVFQDPVNFEYTSAPIQGLEDFLEFNVEIKSRKNSDELYVNEEKEFRYFEFLKGGIRLDFSAGAVFNFGTQNYVYNIDNNKIVEESKNQFMPDLGVFFHSSFRENGNSAFGFTLGTSLNLATFDINSIYAGTSLLLGKKDKFIFTVGPAFRSVEQLKKNLSVGSTTSATDPQELMIKNFRIGGFFAISYNLTQKQKGQIKINGTP